MNTKKFFIIPSIILLVSIITSIIAFQQTKQLNNGYIYIDDTQVEIIFDGEYFLLLGNLGNYSDTITLENQTDSVLITIFDVDEVIIREYNLKVNKAGSNYNQSIILSMISTDKNDVDNLEEHLLTIYLEKGEVYEFSLEQTENHPDSEEIDVVFVNIPEHILNMKNIMESISFTTGIFTIISFLTILAILYVKKE
jgi:hypothetical protein